jgi:hypothetical protein
VRELRRRRGRHRGQRRGVQWLSVVPTASMVDMMEGVRVRRAVGMEFTNYQHYTLILNKFLNKMPLLCLWTSLGVRPYGQKASPIYCTDFITVRIFALGFVFVEICPPIFCDIGEFPPLAADILDVVLLLLLLYCTCLTCLARGLDSVPWRRHPRDQSGQRKTPSPVSVASEEENKRSLFM